MVKVIYARDREGGASSHNQRRPDERLCGELIFKELASKT